MGSDIQAQEEFVSLLTNHQEVIRSYIISQIPGSPDVRDVLQDVNLVLWQRSKDFTPGTNFGAWACTMAYYKILDYRKKMKRDGCLVLSDDLSRLLVAQAEEQEPATLEAQRRGLRHCLAKLPQDKQSLLRARYESPLGNMDRVSSETGRTKASLRVTLTRLRAVLRKCIREYLTIGGCPR